MAKIRVIGIMPWGTSTVFVEEGGEEEARAKMIARGAKQVYVGQEAEKYQAASAEEVLVQAMADRDPA